MQSPTYRCQNPCPLSSENINIQLSDLDDYRVGIEYTYNNDEGEKITNTETLILGEKSQTNVNGVNIKLNYVNLNKQARVSIIPNNYGTRTDANFNFKIGIEKRLIQVSPEKTKEMIKNLKEAISDLLKIE